MRRLYERGYVRQDVVQLFRLIDWMMTLPKGLSQQFQQELLTYEEREKMPIISSIEQMAIERGMAKGMEQGIQQGKQEGIQQVARNLLATGMDPAQIATATGLTPEQIRQLQN